MRTPKPNPRPDRQPREPAADPTPVHGRGRRARPGPPGFTFEVQLVGGEEGRRLEQEQTEAIIEVLAWLAAHPPAATAATRSPTASIATNAGTDAGTRTGRNASGDALPTAPTPDGPDQPGRPHSPDDRIRGSRSYPTAVRVQAVGLVGVGEPLEEVARALEVHPAALRRWVLQAWRRWVAAVGLPDSLVRPLRILPAPGVPDRQVNKV
jgi:Transposase